MKMAGNSSLLEIHKAFIIINLINHLSLDTKDTFAFVDILIKSNIIEYVAIDVVTRDTNEAFKSSLTMYQSHLMKTVYNS